MTSPAELMNKVNRKTLHLVLLCAVTGGIYLLIWLYKTNQHLREATGQTVCSETYIIWICVCMGLSGAFIDNPEPFLVGIGALLSIASGVLFIVWAFNARSLLMTYANAHQQPYFSMNAFYTFLFNAYYINYCINELGENAQRQQPIYAQPAQP
ncbi:MULTISPECIES: DUF4234 domain-containing protein [Pseudomonas]|uniref:DUF4234 domain-containing protein n=1 Tax=Pseudomonas putida TaxID=303 RepID=A0A1B2FDV1_PSEPU|nr:MULTISPECIES: DUF4234 domain-containing protein [Pseudomonas]ANY90408.1 hypothetical protein IEC33019_4925 [Pseudomonas putida]MCL8304539.1 DUF4234 domain-containing protein [Pseudomonas putida]